LSLLLFVGFHRKKGWRRTCDARLRAQTTRSREPNLLKNTAQMKLAADMSRCRRLAAGVEMTTTRDID
jgi:hypothetical protein